MSKRKNINGITLISLTLTIIVLMILTTITTYSGINIIKESKLNTFKQELEIMEAQVNLLYEKYKDQGTINIGKEITEANITNKKYDQAQEAFEACSVTDKDGYTLFDEETIEDLGIEGLKREYLVNIKERDVICLEGFKYNGETYYRLKDVVTEKNKVTGSVERGSVTFDVALGSETSSGWTVTMSNIEFSKYVGKGKVQYSSDGGITWKTIETELKSDSYDFTIKDAGTYKIKITDAAGVESEVKEIIINETISETVDCVGCYADVDGDGEVDGIIYADLARETTSGEWNDSNGAYKITQKSNFKKYYVSDTGCTKGFNDPKKGRDVISVVDGSIGNNRFYVMGLSDFTTSSYWYNSANGNSETSLVTSNDFGTGKTNTETMIDKWSGIKFGSQNTGDVWGVFKNELYYDKLYDKNGKLIWYVPSRGEWGAFASAFSINKTNYADFGLSYFYWSSSQYDYDTNYVWFASFNDGLMSALATNLSISVRLGATF